MLWFVVVVVRSLTTLGPPRPCASQCPKNAWLIAIFFFVGAIAACLAGYVLNRKNVNMSVVTIGVDYFQVLALFARSKVTWPESLRAFFRIMSIFNINLEITAPECSIPDVSVVQHV